MLQSSWETTQSSYQVLLKGEKTLGLFVLDSFRGHGGFDIQFLKAFP